MCLVELNKFLKAHPIQCRIKPQHLPASLI